MRPRMLKLHHMTRSKLWRLKDEAEKEGARRVAKRIHAVLLNSDGRTSGEVANILGSPLSCVTEWLRNYDELGLEGLKEGHRCGRPRRLTNEQLGQLDDIVDSGPVAYGFLGGVWTSPMIARVIEDEFNCTYHPGHVRKILKQLGFSVQRPGRRLIRADVGKRGKWERYTYPNLKKKRRNGTRR